jgi:ribosomal protein S18 acetylase RimI-like enzyme
LKYHYTYLNDMVQGQLSFSVVILCCRIGLGACVAGHKTFTYQAPMRHGLAAAGNAATGKQRMAMDTQTDASGATSALHIDIRRVRETDLAHVVALDERVTDIAKPDYWRDIHERYAERRIGERFFLIAEDTGDAAEFPLLGYIVGEIRAWEFGSEPCGWVFAFSVEPGTRLQGIGERLFEAISTEFKNAGIKTMRTMVARHNRLHMAFFRSEGMVAGPYVQLDMNLDE